MIFGPDIRAIVFDMDGVLWHSSAAHAAAYRTVLGEAGLDMPDYATIAGRRTDDVMRELLTARSRTAAEPGAVAALTAAKQACARRLLREEPPVDRDCEAVVSEIARGRIVALASSASAATVSLFLDASGTRHLFQATVSGDEVGIGKPDPAIYAEALHRVGCAPAEAAVVEDAPSGVAAALAAGVARVIGVEGTVPREALLKAGACRVVPALRGLVGA
jgi:HAD superfamily hydrolase (TIGR01509 family)